MYPKLLLCFVIFFLSTSLQAQNFGRSDLNNVQLLAGATLAAGGLTSSESNDFNIKPAIGYYGAIITSKMFGIGASYTTNEIYDKTDSTAYFANNNVFIDLYYRIPIPEIFELLIGLGLGNASLDCESDNCKRIYRGGKITKNKAQASHAFIMAGFWIGRIYNLHVGLHLIDAGAFEVTSETYSGSRDISLNYSTYSAGLGIVF